jgi:hypothetical protein
LATTKTLQITGMAINASRADDGSLLVDGTVQGELTWSLDTGDVVTEPVSEGLRAVLDRLPEASRTQWRTALGQMFDATATQVRTDKGAAAPTSGTGGLTSTTTTVKR